ncbi:hypothetical protein D3C86_670840 [compost metagenome]
MLEQEKNQEHNAMRKHSEEDAVMMTNLFQIAKSKKSKKELIHAMDDFFTKVSDIPDESIKKE